ncbi:hypothetical protein ES706_05399 [subsurface metagenome]
MSLFLYFLGMGFILDIVNSWILKEIGFLYNDLIRFISTPRNFLILGLLA